ncbi:nucleotidyltransferase [Streptomyces sp. NPDC015131]|uniref:nucleotidyltransferase domain-containing protein n=1 Tax=Streptomyces sp. NPDC015131 TaxID=3364941 RepID=UPI0036F71811
MTATSVERVLARFVADVRLVVPAVAVWAHGSLALGDFRPERSDLDLIAVVGTAPSGERWEALAELHQRLMDEEPAAAKLHCSYMARDALADSGADHVTWAHGRMLERPVTPVTRRELFEGGRVLYGPEPARLLPPLAEGELEEYVRRNLATYWLPATGRPWLWWQDGWVDLGMLVLARSRVTLREGRLTTKREALAELLEMGAPPDVVRDIRDRRYGAPGPIGRRGRARRAVRARAFVRRGIRRTLAEGGERGAPSGTGGESGAPSGTGTGGGA